MSLNKIYVLCIVCAILFLDAEGKEKGVVSDYEYSLMPKLFQNDPYDYCMLLGNDALYCSIELQLSPTNPTNYSDTWRIIKEVISSPKNYRHDRLRHGICVPIFCPELDKNVTFLYNNQDILKKGISQCYSRKYAELGLAGEVREMHCETTDPPIPIDGYDIAVLVFFMLIIAIVGYGSYYEGSARYKSKEEYDEQMKSKYGQIISCFSIPKNWDRLRSTNTSVDGQRLKVINGIRFHTMALVIMVHACLLSFVSPVENTRFVEQLTENPITMLVVNGTVAIQTFFVMAGLLLTYHFLQTFEGKKDVKFSYIFWGFVNRYIRLTPAYLVTLAFNATWLQHMNRGPVWYKTVEFEYRNCRKNWWANLLYINNYYDKENICMQQSWYLASDTQLFVCALFVMVILWKYQNHIKLILGTCFGLGVLVSAVINYVYDYDIVVRNYPEGLYTIFLDLPQFHMMYSSAYSNITGYVIGMIFGYIFYKYRDSQVFTKTWHVAVWWIITWVLPLGIIYVGIIFYLPGYVPQRIPSAIYAALAKPIFAVGVIVGIFGISKNVGWFLRDAVLWQPLQTLGRLTYCVFLVHTSFIRIKAGITRAPAYSSIYIIFMNTVEDMGISYIAALVLCLLVELPVSALQKVFVPQLANKRATDDENKLENVRSVTNVKENGSNGVPRPEEKHSIRL